MGGFNPITTVLSSVLGGVLHTYDAADDYKRARQSYDQQEKQIQKNTALQQQQLALQADQDATDRRNALKRAMAKQQAAFGGQGISTNDGSGEAVLLGLLQQNDEDKEYADKLTQLKNAALAQDADDKRQRNLLSLQGSYAQSRNSIANNLLGAL